jgi:NADH-quinone oxidoreductase subunit A
MGAISLIALLIAAIAFSAGGIIIGKIFVKGSKNAQKGQAYECGIPTDSSPWHQFNVGYYLFALLFLIFDVELVFLYPWAVVVKKVGMVALIEIIVFHFIWFIIFYFSNFIRIFKF